MSFRYKGDIYTSINQNIFEMDDDERQNVRRPKINTGVVIIVVVRLKIIGLDAKISRGVFDIVIVRTIKNALGMIYKSTAVAVIIASDN